MAADPVHVLAEEIRRTASSASARNRWFHPEGWGVTESGGCVYVIGPREFGGNLSLTSWTLEPVCRIVAEAILSGDPAGCRRRLTGPPQTSSTAAPKRKRAPKPKEEAG
jgi:hypothetical protein